MPISNNIENIIGVNIPSWIQEQLRTRSNMGSLQSRDNTNLVYLANRSGWVRMVSGVDMGADNSLLQSIKANTGQSIGNGSDLAKKYVLFGGMSSYKGAGNYELRNSISQPGSADGAYGMLGNTEIRDFGYRPMPGITKVSIQTQGKLGSLRVATVDFKAHDKYQLDILDALYLRLGYSMFLEWGNTYFYDSENAKELKSSELYCIDPFVSGLTKEAIIEQINTKVKKSKGNYDAMLGVVTNFNFSSDGAGGFNCSVKLMALGVLGESIKTNAISSLPQRVQNELEILVQQTNSRQRSEIEQEINAREKSKLDSLFQELEKAKYLVESYQQLLNLSQQKLTDLQTSLQQANASGDSTTADSLQTQITDQNKKIKDREGQILLAKVDAQKAESALTKAQTDIQTEIDQKFAETQKSLQIQQKKEAGNYSSSIEYILRSLQIDSFSAASKKLAQNPQGATKLQVIKRDYSPSGDAPADVRKAIFANGSLTGFLTVGLGQLDAVHGFAKAMMASPSDEKGLVRSALGPVKLSEIMNTYIVTYRQNQDLLQGANLNYPCYIPLSFFIMLLNHVSLLYEHEESKTAGEAKIKSPIIYIDFHPKSNICLTNAQAFSTNPYYFLIPFEGSQTAYNKIFDPTVLDGVKFRTESQQEELWKKTSEDTISKELPTFRKDSPYRGYFMNALVSVDYLLKTIKSYVVKDENNSIYLKNLLEQIISDFNKSTGGFNSLRLAYSDAGNCYYFSDEQAIKTDNQAYISNVYEMPLYGLKSIAESFEIKTDLSTKLSSLIAISARADLEKQASAGMDATPFGKMNTYYIDRYKKNVAAAKDTGGLSKLTNKGEAEAAAQFNHTVKIFFGVGINSEDKVQAATNYLIDRMAKLKAADKASQASTVIPVSLNFTTDGISGIYMGQSFTISENLLPYGYSVTGLRKVGFIVTGVDHTIESNRWKSTVKALMYWLKADASVYTSGELAGVGENQQTGPNLAQFAADVGPTGPTGTTGGAGGFGATSGTFAPKRISKDEEKANEIRVATFLKDKGLKPYQVAAVMAHLSHESGFYPGAENKNDNGLPSIGIAQWRGARNDALSKLPGYQTLPVQLDYLWREFQTHPGGKALLASQDFDSAFNAMAKFEAYQGYNNPQSPSYQSRYSTANYYRNTYLPRTLGGSGG